MGLRAGKPQRGTISRWNVGDRLADFVKCQASARVWSNLSTAQQEAACAEIMRKHHAHRPELPRLRRCFSRLVAPYRAYWSRQNQERLTAGPLWQDNDLVFPTLTGTTTSGTNLLGRHFKPLLKRAELPPIRFHDLRHTCATILLTAGKHPKFVQELLGHASISITLDTYSHVIEGMDGGLADAMDEAL